MNRIALAMIVLVAIAGSATAQWDTDGPNAAFAINGQTPSVADAVGHQVTINVPDTMALTLTSGANPTVGFLLLNGALNAAAFAAPWGGSIDVGVPSGLGTPPSGVTIVVDSLFFSVPSPFAPFALTPFTMSATVGASFAGVNVGGFQAIMGEPTMPPLFFDNTEAGGPTFANAVVTVYDAIGDDANILHSLNGSATPSGVTFGGIMYTQFYIGSNGVVSFAAGVNDFSATTAEFFSGFQPTPTAAANPGIALGWQDLARGGVADDITIIESPTAGTVRVEYNNQEHWDSQLTAGSWSGTFDNNTPGLFTFDMTGLLIGDPSMDSGPLVGLTDGDDTVGTDYVSDLSVDQGGGYTSAAGPESIVEDFLATAVLGAPLDITVVNLLDLGGHMYTIF